MSRTLDQMVKPLLRNVLLGIGRAWSRLVLKETVVGRENIPRDGGPIIVVSNHFSWFDAPLLTMVLPFQPTFMVATESQRRWYVRMFMRAFNGIPVWRGRVDRKALREALGVLQAGGAIGIFPEGGIDPSAAQSVAAGETVDDFYGHTSRLSGELVRARPGTALLAVQSQARILPVGLIGTERILGNMLRMRRTPVTVHIGPAFGPLTLDGSLHGRERRRTLNNLADNLMERVAALFPPENRGPYRVPKHS